MANKKNNQPSKLSAFIIPIFILACMLGGTCWFVPKISSGYNSYNDLQKELENKDNEINAARNELEALKQKQRAEQEKEANAQKSEKQFFKPIMSGLATENIITGEFSEVLQLIRANKIKVRSIKYDYDPSDDNFIRNAPDKYNVARLNMEMISEYSNYDNFLKELYKHDHFIDIETIEIVPYRKNKKILLINLRVKLYAKKG